jgi:Domain of unknown function (DU1801)
MPNRAELTVADHLRTIPPAVRPIVRSARRTVKQVAPRAKEIAYQSRPPRSSRSMWKIIRYVVDEEYVAAIGTFPTYATLFFPRGRELDDGSGLLEGSGKDFRFVRLRTPADSARPAVKRLVREAVRLARPTRRSEKR